jgi:hypothetical protein
MPDEKTQRDWYKFLTEGEKLPQRLHHLMGLLPSSPRCKICNAPFKGWGRIPDAADGQGTIAL